MSKQPSNPSWGHQFNLWLWQVGLRHISHLNPEQVKHLAEYRERWLRITLSTTPVDKLKAESAIDWVYRCVNLAPPKVKLWLDNPLEGCIGAYLITLLCQTTGNNAPPSPPPKSDAGKSFQEAWQQVKDTAKERLGEAVWTTVWESVWLRLKQQVLEGQHGHHIIEKGDSIWHLPESTVFAQVKNRFRVKVWLDENTTERTEVNPKVISTIRNAVSTPVAQQARDQYIQLCNDTVIEHLQQLSQQCPTPSPLVADASEDDVEAIPLTAWETTWLPLRDALQKASSGAHKCYNLSFFSYLNEVCGLPMDVLYGVWQGAEHCGWYWRFGGVALLLPKPSTLTFKEGKLHSEGTPAITFPGGFEVYAHMGERYKP